MRILWLSRHLPSDVQQAVLQEKFGDIEIELYKDTVTSADVVLDAFMEKNCQEMVVVLPVDLLADLLALLKSCHLGVRPIRAVMKRTVLDDGDVANEFSHFERILDLNFVKERL